jgi:hypothetical protein
MKLFYVFIFIFYLFIFIIHLFTCAYIAWVIPIPCLLPCHLPPPPLVPGRSCSAFILVLLKK